MILKLLSLQNKPIYAHTTDSGGLEFSALKLLSSAVSSHLHLRNNYMPFTINSISHPYQGRFPESNFETKCYNWQFKMCHLKWNIIFLEACLTVRHVWHHETYCVWNNINMINKTYPQSTRHGSIFLGKDRMYLRAFTFLTEAEGFFTFGLRFYIFGSE